MKKKQRKKWMQIYQPWNLVLFWVLWALLLTGVVVAMAIMVRHVLVGLPIMMLLTGLILMIAFNDDDEDIRPLAAFCIGLPTKKMKQAFQRIAALFIEKGDQK